MLYVHMSAKQSLRDTVDSLVSKKKLWYHLGIRSISRNNLSHSLKMRSYKIFEDTFYIMLAKLNNARGEMKDKRFKFKMPVVSFDSTTIGLCLSLFEWAEFRKTKSGIRLHVMYNNKNQLPGFINITTAKVHDIKGAQKFNFTKNTIYTFDKGYICFDFFSKINKNRAFFVTRTKSNTQFKIMNRHPKTHKNVKADWTVKFNSYKKKDYPENLRIVRYKDPETNKVYEFITNNFSLSAKTIADIYKSRWDIELFFKWIKQNLKIKKFIGTSENAVMVQLWTAMIAYLLTEFIRYLSKTAFSVLKTFRILSENLLFNVDISEMLSEESPPSSIDKDIQVGQLCLDF